MPVPVLAALALATFGGQGIFGPFWTLPSRFLRGTSIAVGIGFINTIGNLGGFVGPYCLGTIKDRTQGFFWGYLLLSLMVCGAAAIALQLRRESTFKTAPAEIALLEDA